MTPHVTADTKVYDGTTTATIATATLTGAVTGDDREPDRCERDVRRQERRHRQDRHRHRPDAHRRRCRQLPLNATAATTTADITALALVGEHHGRGQGLRRHQRGDHPDPHAGGRHRAPTWSAYVGGAATFADKNVGTGKTVTVTGIAPDRRRRRELHRQHHGDHDGGHHAAGADGERDGPEQGLRRHHGRDRDPVRRSRRGDDLTLSYATASFADKNVGTGKPVSVSGINVTGGDAGNYTFNTTRHDHGRHHGACAHGDRDRPEQDLRRHHGGDGHPGR